MLRDFFRKLKRVFSEDDQIPTEARVILDLDRLGKETVGFRLGGRVHKIALLDTQTFLNVINDLASLDMLRSQNPPKLRLVAAGYAKVITRCVPTMTTSDVYSMTVPQRAALMQQIIEIISGKAFSDSQKKTAEIQAEPSQSSA